MLRQNASILVPKRFDLLHGPAPQLPPSSKDPGPSITTRQFTALNPPSPELEGQEPHIEAPEALQEAVTFKEQRIRDAAVVDEVWGQLQWDREAEAKPGQEYQDWLKAQQTAGEQQRHKMSKRLLEAEERRLEADF
ncbi:hypothetical protein N0V93_010356 [Gnomoniopsis smithogilvyi]|uniref:Uncharacterized protein n=1 Tax=Gnomoniopsis smithogilvyi TaxID=1191159 RepID=A0A9W8YJ40_9PEZI|nr:hypothetical protein N0V93_010356 [Gnomoniopsis smithogilvyi]